MTAGSFTSPRYEERQDAARPLQAIAGYNDEPLPLDIHVHPELEAGIVLAGEERISFSETALSCGPGDVWLCGMWEPHGWEIRPPRTHNVVLKFLPEFLGARRLGDMPWLTPFLAPPSWRPRVVSAGMRRRVTALGQWLRREVQDRRPAWEHVVRVELLHLLVELGRGWDGRDVPRATEDVSFSALARMMPALNLVHSPPWRRISVREAASGCGLSASQFQDVFRRALGMSFGQFCLRARLSLAAHRLLNTDRPTVSIATEMGSVDDCHLHRRFARQYGCTPAQYRARREAVS
jgi:AraC-like DNA-binding protein